MSLRNCLILGLVLTGAAAINAADRPEQRTVRASAGWVTASTAEATAGAVVENGTMYDVYIVGAQTDSAGAVELVQVRDGKSAAVKEVVVAAFERLEMAPGSVFLKLTQLKQPLNSGETVKINLRTDSGEILSVDAVVK
jgi:copper(I)-binding protein